MADRERTLRRMPQDPIRRQTLRRAVLPLPSMRADARSLSTLPQCVGLRLTRKPWMRLRCGRPAGNRPVRALPGLLTRTTEDRRRVLNLTENLPAVDLRMKTPLSAINHTCAGTPKNTRVFPRPHPAPNLATALPRGCTDGGSFLACRSRLRSLYRSEMPFGCRPQHTSILHPRGAATPPPTDQFRIA